MSTAVAYTAALSEALQALAKQFRDDGDPRPPVRPSGRWQRSRSGASPGRLAGCDLNVVATVFQSHVGDESLATHEDAWYGAIVQVSGTKQWWTGDVPEGGTRPAQQVITRAGDILLLPKGLPHAATTPMEPGHSVHLAFAINRDDRGQYRPHQRAPEIELL